MKLRYLQSNSTEIMTKWIRKAPPNSLDVVALKELKAAPLSLGLEPKLEPHTGSISHSAKRKGFYFMILKKIPNWVSNSFLFFNLKHKSVRIGWKGYLNP